MHLSISDLPLVNATLNGIAAVFLAAGFIFIKRGNPSAHRACMLAALTTSVIFLSSYLTYHIQVRAVTRFTGQGWIRPVYFFILITHVILAVAIVPLVGITVRQAIRQRWEAHRRIARWTWPLWMYVSVTGVIVYVLLYQIYPAPHP